MTSSKQLKKRKRNFYDLFKNKKLIFNDRLFASGKVEKSNLINLQEASKNLLLSSLIGATKNKKIKNLDFDQILDAIKRDKPKNITHNGLVVPKKETTLEYNLFVKSFYFFIKNLSLSDCIKYFIGPPQLRIKYGIKKKKLLNNSSEHVHSDAWTQLNTKKSITIFLPIYGDVKRNYVEFYSPKDEFHEKWLNTKYFAEASNNLLRSYKKVKLKYSLGQFILADCSTLHKSVLLKNAKPRVSIDIGIIPKNVKNFKKLKNHIEKKNIDKIGFSSLFLFNNSIQDKISFSKDGRKTMSNRKIYHFSGTR